MQMRGDIIREKCIKTCVIISFIFSFFFLLRHVSSTFSPSHFAFRISSIAFRVPLMHIHFHFHFIHRCLASRSLSPNHRYGAVRCEQKNEEEKCIFPTKMTYTSHKYAHNGIEMAMANTTTCSFALFLRVCRLPKNAINTPLAFRCLVPLFLYQHPPTTGGVHCLMSLFASHSHTHTRRAKYKNRNYNS